MNPARPHLRAAALALVTAFLALAAPAHAQDDVWAQDLRAAEDSLLKGKLTRARSELEEILLAAEEEPENERPEPAIVHRARQGLLELDLRTGSYAEVQAAVEALPEDQQAMRGFAVLHARALARQGNYERAIERLQAVVKAHPQDAESWYRLGDLQARLGKRDDAHASWQRAAAVVEGELANDPLALAWAGRALMRLGGRSNLELASRHLVASMRAAPERPEAAIAYGQLNFMVYGEAAGFPSGERQLTKVLQENGEIEEALLSLYRLRRSNFQLDPRKTEDYLERALALNPKSVAAMVERATLLLDDRRFDDGVKELERALAIDPRDHAALSHRAAAAFLMHEEQQVTAFRDRARAVNPSSPELDRVLGDHLVALYRFADAVPYYEAALAKDGADVPSLHGMAKALIYTGRGHDAKEWLSKAKELQQGFVNPWRENALVLQQLIEEEYRRHEEGPFRFWFHRDDYDVLVAYMVPWHLRAMQELGAKYRYEPEHEVRIEVLHEWQDFSVRTIGFRGFSALGACFGRLTTIVSPGDHDLRTQDFMWTATVWHEYAHVLTLGLSKHRVPRWLTEGFSVHEERAKNRSWERGMDRELYDAFHNGDIYPLELLNQAFRGPRILFGYYQGGLIVDFLAEQFGFEKVVAMLRGYAEDRSTADIFQDTFGITTREFDRRFLKWVEETRLRGLKLVPHFNDEKLAQLQVAVLKNPDDLDARVDLGWAFAHRNNPVDAGQQLAQVLGREAGHGRGLLLHAELLRRREALDEAVEAYRKGFAAGADDFDSRVHFGELLAKRGDLDGAIEQFQAAKVCWPNCTEQAVAPQLLLAEVLRKQDREAEAMAEMAAYCGLTARAFKPRLDLAAWHREKGQRDVECRYLEEAVQIDPFMRDLHVQLAESYEALGRRDEAMREWRVALAVPPALDRANARKPPGEVPAANDPSERLARGHICLRLARLCRESMQRAEAEEWLRRAEQEAPDSEVSTEAAELRRRWG